MPDKGPEQGIPLHHHLSFNVYEFALVYLLPGCNPEGVDAVAYDKAKAGGRLRTAFAAVYRSVPHAYVVDGPAAVRVRGPMPERVAYARESVVRQDDLRAFRELLRIHRALSAVRME